MGKKLRNFFALIIGTLGLILVLFTVKPTQVCAADYYTNSSDNGLLTGMKIDQKDYGTASNVGIHLTWDATDKNLANGDTWTIQLPDELKVSTPSTSALKDNDGNEIGEIHVNADNTVTIKFTQLPDDKADYKGTIDLVNGITPSSKANIGNNNVTIGDFTDNMTVVTSDADFSKKGVLGTDAEGNSIITWTILVNRNSGDFPNLRISDYIDPTVQPGQKYIEGSVNVYEASWSSPGYYKKDRLLGKDEYNLTESENGFELNGLNNNQFYAVTLQTKVTDQSNASDGSKFRNKATYKWGQGSGNTDNEATVNASVTGNSNGGSGDGSNITGSVTLTKTSTVENTKPVAGAVYSLYKEGSNTPLKTGLTTDENGQITVENLPTGNYYFKESQAAPDYKPNDLEIPFQIDSSHKVVYVTTEDSPETKNHVGSIAIMKIDNETGYRLAGAEFEILNEAGEVVGTFTTDDNGIGNYYDLPIGKYTLRETKAPDGYIKGDNDYEFEITEQELTPALISVENEKQLVFDDSYFVNLQKFDRDDMSTGVPGAEYTLYDEFGNPIETKTTDSNGMITVEGLKPGNYYFQETKAPDGYLINDDKIQFTITSGSTSTQTLTTSDPKDTEGNITEPGDNNGNEGNTSEPGDNNGNEGNTSEPDDNNNGGVIVDPEHPGSNNNNGNTDEGIITNPSTGNSNATLPQTGEKSSLMTGLIGLVLLSSIVYFRRRKA